ncbi:hypothetical protein QOT17_005878 [Balamuthia mandrillaris]
MDDEDPLPGRTTEGDKVANEWESYTLGELLGEPDDEDFESIPGASSAGSLATAMVPSGMIPQGYMLVKPPKDKGKGKQVVSEPPSPAFAPQPSGTPASLSMSILMMPSGGMNIKDYYMLQLKNKANKDRADVRKTEMMFDPDEATTGLFRDNIITPEPGQTFWTTDTISLLTIGADAFQDMKDDISVSVMQDYKRIATHGGKEHGFGRAGKWSYIEDHLRSHTGKGLKKRKQRGGRPGNLISLLGGCNKKAPSQPGRKQTGGKLAGKKQSSLSRVPRGTFPSGNCSKRNQVGGYEASTSSFTGKTPGLQYDFSIDNAFNQLKTLIATRENGNKSKKLWAEISDGLDFLQQKKALTQEEHSVALNRLLGVKDTSAGGIVAPDDSEYLD